MKQTSWKVQAHTIFKDDLLAATVHKMGFCVVDFVDDNQINKLQNYYDSEHEIKDAEGGMFYSLYSQKIAYRNKTNTFISEILKPSTNRYFQNYKEVVNSFIVKFPGPKSEFFIHQDTTGLDEFQYSPLSVWLPLEDVDETNGCICLVPKSHHFFGPYRGISFPSEFENIRDTVAKYLIPISLKKGQALIFDPRVVHNSLSNRSNKARVVTLTGLFPEKAPFVHCYADMNKDLKEIEFYLQGDNFLIEYPNLLVNCTERPVSGQIVNKIPYEIEQMSKQEFLDLCSEFGLEPSNKSLVNTFVDCKMIAEPNHFELDN